MKGHARTIARDPGLARTCGYAIRDYHLVTALTALEQAESASIDVSGSGPYLLVWAPAIDKGKPGAPVLRLDLSDVTTPAAAEEYFSRWRTDIEQNPKLWNAGGGH